MKTKQLIKRTIELTGLLLLASLFVFAQTPSATQAERAASLDAQIKAEITKFKGQVWLYAKNLDTGADYGLNPDERVRTASTIKLPIMVEAFARVAEGKAKW